MITKIEQEKMNLMGVCSNYHGTKATKIIRFSNQNEKNGRPNSKPISKKQ